MTERETEKSWKMTRNRLEGKGDKKRNWRGGKWNEMKWWPTFCDGTFVLVRYKKTGKNERKTKRQKLENCFWNEPIKQMRHKLKFE